MTTGGAVSHLPSSSLTTIGSSRRHSLLLLLLSLAAQAHCFHASSPATPKNIWGRKSRTARDLSQEATAESDSSQTASAPHLYQDVYDPIPRRQSSSKSLSLDDYKTQYAQSIQNPSDYWADIAKNLVDWDVPFTQSLQGNFQDGDVSWFANGQLNVCYNAVDRHAQKTPDKTALLWEGDEPTQVRRITYQQLQDKVSQIAHALTAQGVQAGDVVTIYMPMIPELCMTMLACARLGAVHSVVFAGFSADALAARVVAANSHYIVTANQGKRGSKTIPLLDIVIAAQGKDGVDNVLEKVLVWDHGMASGGDATYHPPTTQFEQLSWLAKHVSMDELVNEQSTDFAPVSRNAEDPLFILYTSGTCKIF
jgi:acetyl-CoA synthetase